MSNGVQTSGDPMPEQPRHLFDDPRNVTRVIRALFVACGLLLAVDLLDVFGVLYHKHVYFDFEGWFGFYAFFAFILCCVLVLAAKVMRKPLKRDEDYYDDV